MDNLTHSLVGLFLARAGLKRFTPRGTAIMVLGANAPDLDAVSWFGGPMTYIQWHRHITHSLLAIPFMALLTVAIVRILGRRAVRWWPAVRIAIIAVASHIILDLTNVYGVRLLLPFSAQWFHWDLTPIVDLIIWGILLMSLGATFLARLVGSEIGERRRKSSGAGWAIVALLLVTAYDYGRSVLHDHAAALMDSRTYAGFAPRSTTAFPGENPVRWMGVAQIDNGYVEVPINLLGGFDPESAITFHDATKTPAVQSAAATPPFRTFLQFDQFPIWTTAPSPDLERGTVVSLIDLRFGTPAAPGFEATATVTDRNQVVNPELSFGLPLGRGR